MIEIVDLDNYVLKSKNMKSKILRKLQINKVTISSIKGGITDPEVGSYESSHCPSVGCIRQTTECTSGMTLTSAGRSLGCASGN